MLEGKTTMDEITWLFWILACFFPGTMKESGGGKNEMSFLICLGKKLSFRINKLKRPRGWPSPSVDYRAKLGHTFLHQARPIFIALKRHLMKTTKWGLVCLLVVDLLLTTYCTYVLFLIANNEKNIISM